MRVLIIKLGATGDVVRTTPLLTRLEASVTWITDPKNLVLLEKLERHRLRSLSWKAREQAHDVSYDLVINLEDTIEVAQFVQSLQYQTIFGAYLGRDNKLAYTDTSHRWFDLSLISKYGREEADRLKFLNRQAYQALIFEGLGFRFAGEKYLLPKVTEAQLSGDVAIAPEAGPVWPMKNWAYVEDLIKVLQADGLTVNILPKRASLLEHLSDVCNHRCLVGGDSLPMHLALGSGTRCVSLFTCTSPWEIYDYGIQTKIISPLLAEYFYHRGYDRRAVTAISVAEVHQAVLTQLEAATNMKSSPAQAFS